MSDPFAKPFMLRASERVLLRRALQLYARFYLDLKAKSKQEWEKVDCQQYIDAADALSERLKKSNRKEI